MPSDKNLFLDEIVVLGKKYKYFSIPKIAKSLSLKISAMPCVLKILLENHIRNTKQFKTKSIEQIKSWPKITTEKELTFMPSRILMQDFTGIPALLDLAAMRDAVEKTGHNPNIVNPIIPVDLIVDHSVQVDFYGSNDSYSKNIKHEYARNKQRYEFLKWCQGSFQNLKIVPPGMGICHQVNLEFLANVVSIGKLDSENILFPDTLLGTDSHTTMINALGALGWGVGGIEAEAAMLGHALTIPTPKIVGVRLSGQKHADTNATDIALYITNMLRKKNVVSKFVEFYGPGTRSLSLPDRATISNMAPEYGATCGFFAIDQQTVEYLATTGRSHAQICIIEQYAKTQGIYADHLANPMFSEHIEINLGNISTLYAGPKRPQDILTPAELKNSIARNPTDAQKTEAGQLQNGDIVIAAITSCTNTSNPHAMIGAGMMARNLLAKGLKAKPWVKTSLTPGSRAVAAYLRQLDLLKSLESLGFNLAGYGCATCIGNSGPLDDSIAKQITTKNLSVAAVLSGNRNFEGRIHPLTKLNYLMSPIMIPLYAVTGTVNIDPTKDPIGYNANGKPVFLADVMPLAAEIENATRQVVNKEIFTANYSRVFDGDENWQSLKLNQSATYQWDESNLYIQKPPYFDNYNNTSAIESINNAHILALFGDSITTDHISPAGSIAKNSPAGEFLIKQGVSPIDFNSYGSRRGNHHIMTRGAFSNIRIRNLMTPEIEGGFTRHIPTMELMSIYDAAIRYQQNKQPLVIIAGKEYGTGSSRDWAAKGTALLGVCAIIAESFERIHLANLIGMGVIPLQFAKADNIQTLRLTGEELISLRNLATGLTVHGVVECNIAYKNNTRKQIKLRCMLSTENDLERIHSGGILLQTFKDIIQR